MESRRLRMQATPRGGNTTPRRRLPAFVVEFNKAIVLLLDSTIFMILYMLFALISEVSDIDYDIIVSNSMMSYMI
jgi:hypothetical protein